MLSLFPQCSSFVCKALPQLKANSLSHECTEKQNTSTGFSALPDLFRTFSTSSAKLCLILLSRTRGVITESAVASGFRWRTCLCSLLNCFFWQSLKYRNWSFVCWRSMYVYLFVYLFLFIFNNYTGTYVFSAPGRRILSKWKQIKQRHRTSIKQTVKVMSRL